VLATGTLSWTWGLDDHREGLADPRLQRWLRREDWVNPYRAGSASRTLAVAGPLPRGLDVTRGPGGGPRRFRVVGHAGSVRVVDRDGTVPGATWIHVAGVSDAPWFAVRLFPANPGAPHQAPRAHHRSGGCPARKNAATVQPRRDNRFHRDTSC
jgi:hypothetical protein